MELIFLDRSTLGYKDHGFVDNEFELVVDLVVSQKSNFTVNKSDIKAVVGDIVVLRQSDYSYIGIIETIEVTDDKKTKVRSNDFKELFNVKVPIESYNGDLAGYLASVIRKHFINSFDNYQNLEYLSIEIKTSVEGTLTFDADNLMTITDLIELVSKSYGINLKYKVTFLRGRFTGIHIIIDSVSTGIKLNSDVACISELVISDSSEQVINKMIYYPKKENLTYKNTITYYLLTDGNITTTKTDNRRYKNVRFKCEYYSDKDYEQLETKARSSMISSNLNHSINFTLAMNNNIFHPLTDTFLGDYIKFYAHEKVYDTCITQIKFKNGFNSASITLGEFRNTLTDKIKILTKNMNSSIGNVSISSGRGVTDLDGGEF